MQQNSMNLLNHKCVFSTSLHEYVASIASFFQRVWLNDMQVHGNTFNILMFP
jgi:hypothetical protein